MSWRRRLCNTLWKCDGAFQSPKGSTLKAYNPSWVIKAVRACESGCIGTYQYPDSRSIFEKYLLVATYWYKSSIWGKGYLSGFVFRFSPL